MCGRVGRVREAHHVASQQAQHRGAVLVGTLEEQLQAEADADVPGAAPDTLEDGSHEALAVQAVHGRPAGAHAGDEDGIRVLQVRGRRGDGHSGAQQLQRVADAHQVAGAVVDHGDPHRIGHAGPEAFGRLPFVEATPARRGSGDTAMRNARARALKAASARWWSLRPVRIEVQRGPGRLGEGRQGVLHELRREGADTLAPEGQVDDRVGPPGEVERALGERLVHGHAGGAEARDAGAVAERVGDGGAQDEGHVFDGVVLVDLQVAGRRRSRCR